MLVEDLWRIPMSQELAITLTRAVDTAKNQQNLEITLEHLLVSLIDDHDANEMLVLSNVDIEGLIADALDFESQLARGDLPHNLDQLRVCNNLKRVLESAATAARQGGRKEINGAIVLAAIVGDGKSIASDLLRAKGLTFEQAIRAIQRALTSPPSASSPASTFDGHVENQSPLSLEKSSDFYSDQELQRSQPTFVGGAQSFSNPVTSDAVPLQRTFQEGASVLQGQISTIAKETQQPASPKSAPTDLKPSKGKFSARPPHSSSTQKKHQQGSSALFTMPTGQRSDDPSSVPLNPQRELRHELQKQGRGSSLSSPRNTPPSSLSKRAEPKSQQAEIGQKRGQEAQGGPSSRSKGFPSKGTVRVAASQLVVNLPRRMRVLRPVLVEAKVLRSDIKAISEGLQDGGAVYRHEIAITKAISVRLRAPQGGFWIENASPETQWVENIFGVVSDDFIRWRWTVTPKIRGKKSLQILMSARTVGTDGVAAETALPDQVMHVKVRPNYGKFILKSFNWLILFVLLGLATRHWDNVIEKMSVLTKLIVINRP